MAEVKEMLEYESNRNANNIPPTLVHWRKVGQFFHAYEWSAWVACHFINEFNTQRKKTSNYDYVYVGFPPDSLDKFTPDHATRTQSDDGIYIDMILPADMLDPSVTQEEYGVKFQNWKHSITPQGSKKDGSNVNGGSGKLSLGKELKYSDTIDLNLPMRMTDVMQRIMKFNVVMKSPMDCQNFIVEIQQLISNSI